MTVVTVHTLQTLCKTWCKQSPPPTDTRLLHRKFTDESNLKSVLMHSIPPPHQTKDPFRALSDRRRDIVARWSFSSINVTVQVGIFEVAIGGWFWGPVQHVHNIITTQGIQKWDECMTVLPFMDPWPTHTGQSTAPAMATPAIMLMLFGPSRYLEPGGHDWGRSAAPSMPVSVPRQRAEKIAIKKNGVLSILLESQGCDHVIA